MTLDFPHDFPTTVSHFQPITHQEILAPSEAEAVNQAQRAAERARMERELDEALAATFPASDPVAVP